VDDSDVRRVRGASERDDKRRDTTTLIAKVPIPSGFARPIIEGIRPQVDGGRRPAKTTVGDILSVHADAFVDGRDAIWCELRFRHDTDTKWSSAPMVDEGNDHWHGTIPINRLGLFRFVVRAGVDRFASWRHDLKVRTDGGQDVEGELLVGALLLEEAAHRARAIDRRPLSLVAEQLRSAPRGLTSDVDDDLTGWPPGATLRDVIFSDWIGHLMRRLGDPAFFVTSKTYFVSSDPVKARFSAWYEMFPRSAALAPLRHGTFADVQSRLDYVEAMGFDVLYLPPIHPIGRTGRKGRDGSITAEVGDPGSPWAIGATEGGHTAVHPELGTLEDFRRLVADAAARGIDVAIDLAFQASPDHPWVHEHPDWFHQLPDGTIRPAENPPKRYEDIYPLYFEGLEWRTLWLELLGVVNFWIAQGVSVFRIDNPHTKPFAFWEWFLASVKAEHPETVFLSEAFTRPRVMEQLAKVGFTQSYTYFTWRSTKWEIESYLRELTHSEVADYFRPNFWPNTPDILSDELQRGGRAGFLARLVLAATLSSNYGIYGPAFEHQEHLGRSDGSEEYLRSEKYEIRSWDLEAPHSLAGFIGVVNRIRREHEALQFNDALIFHGVDNEQIMAYSKTRTGGRRDVIVVVVSLDHDHRQSGWVDLDAAALGVDPAMPYIMHDLLTDAHYVWKGRRNFVDLDPAGTPCHVFSLRQTMPLLANETRVA